jgi:hypothetical protein
MSKRPELGTFADDTAIFAIHEDPTIASFRPGTYYPHVT